MTSYTSIYVRCPDGPKGLSALREASRLPVACLQYKFHLHRIQLNLAQPWSLGYRRHPFTTRAWAYLDIDGDAERRQG